MKLAIHKVSCHAQIVSDQAVEKMADTHRVVDVRFSHADDLGGDHYVDVWGGTWRLGPDEAAESTVGVMDRWG